MQFHQLSTVDMSTVVADSDLSSHPIEPIVIEEVQQTDHQPETLMTLQPFATDEQQPTNIQQSIENSQQQPTLLQPVFIQDLDTNQQQLQQSLHQSPDVTQDVSSQRISMDNSTVEPSVLEENQVRIVTVENPQPSSLCSGFLGVYASTNLVSAKVLINYREWQI